MELVITGESHINKKFKKVVNKKEQNPVAKKLRTTKYKQRIIKSKKIYNRNKKIKNI